MCFELILTEILNIFLSIEWRSLRKFDRSVFTQLKSKFAIEWQSLRKFDRSVFTQLKSKVGKKCMGS